MGRRRFQCHMQQTSRPTLKFKYPQMQQVCVVVKLFPFNMKYFKSNCFDFSFYIFYNIYLKPAELDTQDKIAINSVYILGLEMVANRSAIAMKTNVTTSKDALVMLFCSIISLICRYFAHAVFA